MSPNRGLAQHRRETARGFLACAQITDSAEVAAYHVAIAAELGLKGFIIARGASDRWCKTRLRHDLVAAAQAAESMGLAPDPALREIAQTLSPFYAPHWWQGFTIEALPTGFLGRAVGALQTFLSAAY
jgi:hypothetical protein